MSSFRQARLSGREQSVVAWAANLLSRWLRLVAMILMLGAFSALASKGAFALTTTTTTLTAAPASLLAGQAVTLSASVSGKGPTGTITFRDGANTLGSSPIVGDPYWSNVSLLLHGDCINGSTAIADSARINTVTTNGTARIETATVKFGSGAIQAASGSAGWLTMPSNSQLDLSTGDFTLELWLYATSSGAQMVLNKANGTSYYPWQIFINSSGQIQWRGSNTGGAALVYDIIGGTFSTNAWHHVAAVRSGSTFTLYLDGAAAGSATYAGALFSSTTDPVSIGGYQHGLYTLNGFVDDVRITKGVARYLSAFSPPAAALPDVPGAATLATSALTAGVHGLTANYSGDVNNAASTSLQVNLTVTSTATPTTTHLSVSPNPSSAGQRVTLSATVAGGSPTGSVTFKDGLLTLGTTALNAGTATLLVNTLIAGTHSLSASYGGDPYNLASASGAVNTVINAGSGASAGAMTWQYTYDAEGNGTGTVDPNGNLTGRTYDALQRMIAVAQPAPVAGAAMPVTTLAYDGRDRATGVTDPRGLTTAYTRDGLGNVTRIQSPDSGPVAVTYDVAGNTVTRTDARGITHRMAYDVLHRPARIDYPSGTSTVYEYDGGPGGAAIDIGNLTKITDESGSTSYSHDGFGRVIRKTQAVNSAAGSRSFTLATTWGDSGIVAGKVTRLIYPSGTSIEIGYEHGGRPGSVTVTRNGQASILLSGVTYNALQALKGWTWGDGIPYRRTFDNFARLSSYPLGNPQGTGAAMGLTRTLSYDNAGNITGYLHTGQPGFDQTHRYDGLDRLVETFKTGTHYAYQYDAAGNRRVREIGSDSYTHTVEDTSNRLVSVQEPSGNGGTVTRTYQYGPIGNLTSDGVNTFVYGDRGRMSRADTPNGSVSYLVNGLEQRVSKTGLTVPTGVAYYVYDDQEGKLLGEYDVNGTPLYEVIYLRGTPVGVATPTGLYYVYADHIDTPRMIARNTDHAIVWRWDEAEAFGATPPNEDPKGFGTLTFNMRFPGQVYDRETGLFYNWHRDYQPSGGRYIQADPLGLYGGDLTLYTYVGGNPLSYVDPTGLILITGVPGAVGETSIHANPGPNATTFRPEHGPDHVHLGANDGPRVRTSDFKPFSKADAERLSRKQKQFCEGLSEESKDLVRQQQGNIFEYGTPNPPTPRIPLPRIPGMGPIICPLCTIIYPDGPASDYSGLPG